MSADRPRQFVDTNILVYAHDVSSGEKYTAAKQLLADLWQSGHGCLSIQVLQEFYVNVTRKVALPLSAEVARQRVEDLTAWLVHSPTPEDVVEAIRLHQTAKLSFWDAMIFSSATRLDCGTLWSEDLQPGQTIAGTMVRNPFLP